MQSKCFISKIHSTFDYTYNQLQLAYIRAKYYERALDVLGELLNLRVKLYGEHYDGLLNPKLQIAAIQRQLGRNDEALESLQSGLETCEGILEEALTKEQQD
jgi:tetratricopeptide (TPR) repeat protein